MSDIRQLPEGAQVVTLPAAMQRAGISGQILDADLCESGGGYVYRVRFRDESGEIKSIVIPAG